MNVHDTLFKFWYTGRVWYSVPCHGLSLLSVGILLWLIIFSSLIHVVFLLVLCDVCCLSINCFVISVIVCLILDHWVFIYSASLYWQIKKSITVGLIGLPNVGKSSLINSLKRSHVVNVGSTPGLTRSMQEVHLDKNVKLLDCPGVVMPKSQENDASVVLKNCKRIEKLDDPISPGTWRHFFPLLSGYLGLSLYCRLVMQFKMDGRSFLRV